MASKSMESWLSFDKKCQFSLANIPFGIISHRSRSNPHPAIAIGEHALDLEIFTERNGWADLSTIQPHQTVFSEPTLNAFAALGKPMHCLVRKYLQSVLLKDTPFPEILRDNYSLQKAALIPLRDIQYHLPMYIRDYTDFYAGLHHAYNVGSMFRGPDNALQPNYKHLPVAYHGRASSIVVSGSRIKRPTGQILEPDQKPIVAKSKKLDFELELGAFICKPNEIGTSISVDQASEYIFGLVLLNDWSARDIQAWEYVPLGPFNGKNFGTTISPWVVLTEALEPFRIEGIKNDVELKNYLHAKDPASCYAIDLEVEIITKSNQSSVITQVSGNNLLFSFEQMLAHHTLGGCPMNIGDLLGSGTISGTETQSRGSLLEQSENGKKEISIGQDKRYFLEDDDTVILRGTCGVTDGMLVGFGECKGVVSP